MASELNYVKLTCALFYKNTFFVLNLQIISCIWFDSYTRAVFSIICIYDIHLSENDIYMTNCHVNIFGTIFV